MGPIERLRCVVERITYQNAENGYTVLKCAAKNYKELVTVVGNMPEIHVGSVLSMEGAWKVDKKYGRQFSMEKFEETLPATVYGMEKYLGSGLIKGIGPKFAKRIVAKFGKDTMDVIDENPEALKEVDGIGPARIECIKKSWADQKEVKNIMLFLQSHDVSTAHASRIYKTYGSESIAVVTENPYRLADDVWGIGFKTADQIAMKLGIEKNRFMRLRGGILYSLNKLSEEGHCFALRGQLIETAAKLLEVDTPELEITLDEMFRANDLICDEDAIYLPPFYHAEAGVAKRLHTLLHSERKRTIDVPFLMEKVRGNARIEYDEIQLSAIETALSSKVMVLTGGPGTGKTTTLMGILGAYRMAGMRVLLAAPTGRAAKRMSQATGMEAKTIHRLLEYKPPNGYQKNEKAPLDGDVLILDECSMVDLMLMYNLLKALPPAMSLVLVGDTDQLPSVGAGNVLKDIIASGKVPLVRLERIFRQAQGSRIIMNAHRINRGEKLDLRGGKNSDFFFAPVQTGEEAVSLIVSFCSQKLTAYYHADPFRDIQVLTPMQRGPCGAVNLNQRLQQALNPTGPYLVRGGIHYRVHDKVMQIHNDYDKEVFNGDIGVVTRADTQEKELAVDFDGREVTYDITQLDELALAYAVTVHKSQGSEFPIVVMPLTMGHYMMLERNLLYTGVTRAKKILVLVGEEKAVALAVKNKKAGVRNTRLMERIIAGEEEAGLGMDVLFSKIAASDFRSRFTLKEEERAYVRKKGMDAVRVHAQELVRKRLAPAHPVNDGKQTPWGGHPVFPAQHATATCCRGCLEKWHGITAGRELTEKQQDYVVSVIMEWIRRQMKAGEGTDVV